MKNLINLFLAKLFSVFKTKYPHQYAILLTVLGLVALFANDVIKSGIVLPGWATDVINVIAIVVAALGGTSTKMVIAAGGDVKAVKATSGDSTGETK